ncbi:MAG TPA: UDP-N-acetylmuramate dehydrogenase [Acidobacteriaceae bacterium]|nr:UDP-N-acetylmuramate dehydrogenase [Acidobacteriaceae bacterium]
MQLEEQVPLAPWTTLGIGGPARWFAHVADESALAEGVRLARDRGLPLFVLGGGSNLLVSDEGFPGVVLHIAMQGIEQAGDVFHAAAGEDWDPFVSLAIERGYGGLECLAGIPGTVGGTPVQNVGAYGQEVSTIITAVRVFDLHHLTFSELPASACGFAYRRSIFNTSHRGRFVVTRVSYRLRRNAHPVLSYPDLKRHFENRAEPPSLTEAADAVRSIRHTKGMLLVEGDPDCRSAGSFFKNPVVPEADYDQIAAEASAPVPRYVATHGFVKIPAAWLVEQTGFHKGYTLGAAGISSRHTLAIVNRGGATAKEILTLRDQIVAAVDARFRIRLEQEPVWVAPDSALNR